MKNIVYYIAIATVLLFASCASELDTEPSGSQVSDEQLGELIKENADLVLAPMMQGAVNYMHTGNRQATTNDRGFMVWNLGMDLQGNDMVLTKLTNWFADEYMFESIRAHDARKDVVELVIGKSGISLELTDLRVDSSFCKTRNCIKHRRHILCAGFTLLQGFHETYSVRARYRRKFRHS